MLYAARNCTFRTARLSAGYFQSLSLPKNPKRASHRGQVVGVCVFSCIIIIVVVVGAYFMRSKYVCALTIRISLYFCISVQCACACGASWCNVNAVHATARSCSHNTWMVVVLVDEIQQEHTHNLSAARAACSMLMAAAAMARLSVISGAPNQWHTISRVCFAACRRFGYGAVSTRACINSTQAHTPARVCQTYKHEHHQTKPSSSAAAAQPTVRQTDIKTNNNA